MSGETNAKQGEDWESLSFAEQCYYFGCAKYYGLEVEADRKIGLSLLKEAGDLENLDAIRMLISIYEDEDSPDFDTQEALRWRERQVEVCKHLCGMTDEKTLAAFGALAYAYCEAEEFEKARAVSEPLFEMRRSLWVKAITTPSLP